MPSGLIDFLIEHKTLLSVLSSSLALLSGVVGILYKDKEFEEPAAAAQPKSGKKAHEKEGKFPLKPRPGLSIVGKITLLVLILSIATEFLVKYAEAQESAAQAKKAASDLQTGFQKELDSFKKLNKSLDSNNKVQQILQKATGHIDTNLQKNITLEKGVITETKGIADSQIGLLKQQNLANKNIHRVLNKLLPFGINFSIVLNPLVEIPGSERDTRLLVAYKNLINMLSLHDYHNPDFNKETGLVKFDDSKGKYHIHIVPKYSNYGDFSFLDYDVNLGLLTDEELKAKTTPFDLFYFILDAPAGQHKFVAQAKTKFINDVHGNFTMPNGNYFGVDIDYNIDDKTFTVNYATSQIINHFGDPAFQSSDDIQGANLVLFLPGCNYSAMLSKFEFNLPPDFATVEKLKFPGPIKTRVGIPGFLFVGKINATN